MSNSVEHIEYYATCPSCGAANNGKQICDYCGASLIKNVTKQIFNMSEKELEETNRIEDSAYPVINGKMANISPFFKFFCYLFGGLFCGIPVFIGIIFLTTEMFAFFPLATIGTLLFLGAFIVAGIFVIRIPIRTQKNAEKCENGQVIIGIVRGYTTAPIMVNGESLLNIRILINKDTNPTILVMNTSSSERIYPVGKEIRLRNYKNIYMFENKNIFN